MVGAWRDHGTRDKRTPELPGAGVDMGVGGATYVDHLPGEGLSEDASRKVFFLSFSSLDIWFGTPVRVFLEFFLEIQGGLLSGIFATHWPLLSLPGSVRN